MTDEFRKIVDARDTDTLEAAGAFDVSESIPCLEYDYYTLLIDYERGAAGGAVTWKVEFSLDGTSWYQSSIYDGGAVAVNTDTSSNVQREEFIYGATAAGQEFFPFGPVEIDQFAKWMRVSFAESGEVGSPGECGAKVVLTRRKQKTMN
jgi:hypothetical protein